MSEKQHKYIETCSHVLKFYENNKTLFSSAKATKKQYFVLHADEHEHTFPKDIILHTYNSKGEIERTTNLMGKIIKFVPSSFDSDKNTLDIYPNDISVLKKLTFNKVSFFDDIKKYFDDLLQCEYIIIEATFIDPPTRKIIDVKKIYPDSNTTFNAPFGTQHINDDYYITIEENRKLTIENNEYPWIVAIDKKSFNEIYNIC